MIGLPSVLVLTLREREMELDHFSHQHPLTLYDDPEDCIEQLPCFGCFLPLSCPAYKCIQCNFFLHKSCVQLPNKIIHFLHPRHPLTLHATNPYRSNSGCDDCREIIWGFVYHCSLCNFDLDIKCALLQSIVEHEGHQHEFKLFRPTSFKCDACGETGDGMSYVCSTCQLMLHKNCASLPDTIKHKGHPHPFTLAQPTTTKTRKFSCKLCGETLDPSYLGYECVTCKNDSGGSGFKTHVKCTTPKHLLDEDDTFNTTIVGDDENNETHQSVNDDSMVVGMTRLVKEISLVENERVVELQHVSHQHCLTLSANEEDPENDEICEGCTRSISAPFYKCGQCKFFLHVSCAELPNTMLHPLHPHLLTLLAQADSKCGVFCCDACGCWSNGFRYNCDKCNLYFDVRCTSFSKTLKHRNHEHILNLDQKLTESNCNACGESSYRPKFQCDDCDFRLDLGCASLPYEVRHRWDKHPLNLTFYSVVEEEEESGEYYCEICEEEIRDPEKWFYHCEECNFAIHPKCIIWANMIKFGKKGKNYCRPSHILINKYCRKKRPLCYICDQPCTKFAVECADCNIFIHSLH